MNRKFRVFLSVFRPIQTLFLLAFYGAFFSWSMVNTARAFHFVPHLSMPGEYFLICAVVGPMTSGFILAMPFHDAMHASLFALIPGAARRLANWHAMSAAGFALLYALALRHFDNAVPFLPVFGCALWGLSFGTANVHDRRPRTLWRTRILWGICLLAACGAIRLGDQFRAVAIAMPGVLFSAYGAMAVFLFGLNYSRRQARARGRNPYLSMVTMIYCPSALRSRYAQKIRQLMQEGKADRAASDNYAVSIDGSLRSFLAAHHRTTMIGRKRRGGSLQLWSFIVGAGYPLLGAALLGLMLNRIFGVAGFWKQVGRIVAQVAPTGSRSSDDFMSEACVFIPVISVLAFVFAGLIPTYPAFRFPVSRRRLASLVFVSSIRQFLTVILWYMAGTLSVTVLAAELSGSPVLPPLLSYAYMALILLPVLPLLKTLNLIIHGQLSFISISLVSVLVALVGMINQSTWQPWALSAGGIGGSLAALSASLLLYWRIMRWRCCSGDLAFTPVLLNR